MQQDKQDGGLVGEVNGCKFQRERQREREREKIEEKKEQGERFHLVYLMAYQLLMGYFD